MAVAPQKHVLDHKTLLPTPKLWIFSFPSVEGKFAPHKRVLEQNSQLLTALKFGSPEDQSLVHLCVVLHFLILNYVLWFQLKCPKVETTGETYGLQLISGVQQLNVELCGLQIYQSRHFRLYLL